MLNIDRRRILGNKSGSVAAPVLIWTLLMLITGSCSTKNLSSVTVIETYDTNTAIPVYLVQTTEGDTLLAVVEPKCIGTLKEPGRGLSVEPGQQTGIVMRDIRAEDSLSVEYDTTYVSGVVHAFLLYRMERAVGSMVGGYNRLIPLGRIWPKGEVVIECSK